MIIPFTGPGFTARFSNTPVTQSLSTGGQENTDRSRAGNTPISNASSADISSADVGRTDNPSQSNNLVLAKTTATGQVSSAAYDVTPGSSASDGGGASGAPSGDQWFGQSIRAPMSSKGVPKRGNNSKNIFFKFRDQDTPGIWMFINPQQLSINHTKKIPEQVTRGGFVLFHWGDNLDEITASGLTGSFARLNCPKSNTNMGYTGTQPDFGLDRRDTYPYLRFMQLLALYRNNGIGIASVSGGNSGTVNGGFSSTSDPLASAFSVDASGGPSINKGGTNNTLSNSVLSGKVAGSRAQRPNFVGIEMHYDDHVFTGFFTAFTWSEKADEPFKFSFDFKFTVLNTEYNRVFAKVATDIVPNDTDTPRSLLANFQVPRFNSL